MRVRLGAYLLFVLSGASALAYQVVWTKRLTLLFGSTVYAASTVTTAFFAGLALGSHWLGKRADASASPLRLYAILEAAIGLFALAVPLLFSALDPVVVFLHAASAPRRRRSTRRGSSSSSPCSSCRRR